MNRTEISPAVKRLLVRLCEGGMRIKDLARRAGVGQRTIERARGLWRKTGAVHRIAVMKGRWRVLGIEHTQYILGLIAFRPDMYLDEIRRNLHDELKIKVSVSTIYRALCRAGYSLKQSTKAAIERDWQRRATYLTTIGLCYEPNQLVFVDESACDRRTTYRRRAWAYCGFRAFRHAHFVRGKRYSILPALSMDGIIDCTVILGSYTEQRFVEFIKGLLVEMNPFPGKNSVLIMDNCPIHKSPRIRDMVEGRGMHLVYLPGYSPDLNPIEMAFSAVKSWIRRNDDWVRREMEKGTEVAIQMLILAVFSSVTPEAVAGWFEHAGYGSRRRPLLSDVIYEFN